MRATKFALRWSFSSLGNRESLLVHNKGNVVLRHLNSKSKADA